MRLPRSPHARTLRLGALAALAAILVLASPLTAEAQVSGQGQTGRSAALGMVARKDGSGNLQYVVPAGINIHCTRFSSYQNTTRHGGFPRVEITARKCFAATGKQRYLRAVFIDRGEPARDIARIRWGTAWPVTAKNTLRLDRGIVTAGNVQIFKIG